MPLTIGHVLQDRYRIVTLLGQGGMGAVYRAWDLRLKKPVALKEMVPQPGLDAATVAQFREQFEQEAVILARLVHPHLVPVTDTFEEGESAYLVMAFVEGESLADRIRREGALPEAEVRVWAEQLLDALAYCHDRGIVHRDIKPQNVIVTTEGQAVLVDFGLVKLWDPADPQTRTVMRGVGTPEYAPPEQWGAMGRHTDPRSDLYSLGATLYHALTGQAPPTASDRMAYPKQFRAPRELVGRVSEVTDEVILRSMALACDDRWPDARAMRQGFASAPTPVSVPVVSAEPTRTGTQRLPEPEASPVPVSPPPLDATRHVADVDRVPGPQQRRMPPWLWVLVGVAGVALSALGLGRLIDGNVAPAPPATATAGARVSTATAPPAPTPTAAPTPASSPTVRMPGTSRVRSVDAMVEVWVPGGSFRMGLESGWESERPVRAVTLDGFWLDRTEVTNAQYQACVATGRCSQHDYPLSSDFSAPQQPVVEVTWFDASDYCAWVGARLPTEAEWEYAARGPDGVLYPWGNDLREGIANCEESVCKDGYEWTTAPVGSFPEGASWVGALDMAGNVWEWVADWFDAYPATPQTNPTGPSAGEWRVTRGGDYDNDETYMRSVHREEDLPTATYDSLGFRCARSEGP